MSQNWKRFFEMFPDYKNTFTKTISSSTDVIIIGFAFWSKEKPLDYVIWTAKIRDSLIQEWRIFDDSSTNRKLLNIT